MHPFLNRVISDEELEELRRRELSGARPRRGRSPTSWSSWPATTPPTSTARSSRCRASTRERLSSPAAEIGCGVLHARGEPTADPRGDLPFGSIPRWSPPPPPASVDAEALADAQRCRGVDLRISFDRLADEVAPRRAAMAAGIAPGDRVGIWAPNVAEWVVAALGAARGGRGARAGQHPVQGPRGRLRAARGRVRVALFTVRGFLGLDYPAMLEGEDVPALERIVCSDLQRTGRAPRPTVTDEVPSSPGEIPRRGRRGGRGRGAVVGRPVTDAEARARWASVRGDGPLRHHLHLGDDGPAQGRGRHPRPDAAHLRRLVVDRGAVATGTGT